MFLNNYIPQISHLFNFNQLNKMANEVNKSLQTVPFLLHSLCQSIHLDFVAFISLRFIRTDKY